MTDIAAYWQSSEEEQRHIQKQVEQERQADTPGQLPIRSTLANAFDAGEDGADLAVCASTLFIIIVLADSDFGNGYNAFIIALDQVLPWKHLDTIEETEKYIAERAPYTPGSAVWVPIPHYNSRVLERTFLERIDTQKQEAK